MTMQLLLLCVVRVVIMFSWTNAEQCSPPAHLVSSYTVSHSGDLESIQGQGLQWQVKLPSMSFYFTACRCTASLQCQGCSNGFSATIRSTETGRYESEFKVTTVHGSLAQTWIQWYVDGQVNGACQLQLYDYHATPICTSSYTLAPDVRLQEVCTITGVFPPPKCDFYQIRGGQPKEAVPREYIEERDVTSDGGSPAYYDGHCSLSMPVSGLVPGSYTFQVAVYPDSIANGTQYGHTAVSSPFHLSFSKPTCGQPQLTNADNDVTVQCSVTSVYPKFSCDFYKQINGGDVVREPRHQNSSDTRCTKYTSEVRCVSKCTLTLPVTSLGPGQHRFKVTMAMEELGYTGDSELSHAIVLSLPTVQLVSCPDVYVRLEANATCTCSLLQQVQPPATVHWLTSQGADVGVGDDQGNVLLSLPYSEDDENKIYNCQARSTLSTQQIPGKTFMPKFAYGPDGIADFIVPSTFNLCPSTTEAMALTCCLDQAGVSPRPKVTVQGFDAGNLDPDPPVTVESGQYKFHFSVRPSKGQNVTVVCLATNAIFPEINQEAAKEIMVFEPPWSAPVVSIDSQSPISDGQSVDVTSGQTIQFQCQVQGGFPPVTKVTMMCAGQRFEADGSQVTGNITLDKTDHNDTCSCTADHPTGCYDS